ncbi:MAG: glycine C-acetyltransferase [Planctomycetales bacterium]|nr:glycine C-acetyltransferase [bacterium]UNM09651.1 MAG: glycine C-acetyltransferase [Planctomycetales bacterium]
MAYTKELRERLQQTLKEVDEAGLTKDERYIKSAQGVEIEVEYPLGSPARKVLNFCANNYLGLASHPRVVEAAHKGLDERGYGMSSVRFICGTQDSHNMLEERLAEFLGLPAAILFASCFDANAAFFEVFFGKEDVIISDRLIHASLIDGIRLCEAQRDTYKNSDAEHLEKKLQMWQDKARSMCVVTDGVFSMDGMIAPLDRIAELCEKYGALLVVDDSHATGFIGKTGRGTHEHHNVMDKVDVITTTLGKALGGASGGLVAGPAEIVNMLRNRGRPYLFSNAVPPSVIYGALEVMDMLSGSTALRDTLEANAAHFRKRMEAAGFTLVQGESPIVPVMFGDARLAADMARSMLDEGIYVIGFSHPVVPMGKARIRVQLSASHTTEQIDHCVEAFIRCGERHGVIGKGAAGG